MPEFRQDRLYSMLLNTGLQIKDNALYQVIYQLIGAINNLANGINSFTPSGGGGSTTTILQNIFASLDSSAGSDGDGLGIPGPPGAAGEDGANGMVPYFIATGETFTVPEFRQALFAMNIDNEGTLVIDGFLIEVDDNTLDASWLAVFTTQSGNVGAGLTSVYTFPVPANTLVHDGDALEIEALVQCANNANNKLSALTYPGGATFASRSGVTDANFPRLLRGKIIRTGSATSVIGSAVATQGQVTLVGNTTSTADHSVVNDLELKLQGTSDDDIVSIYMTVRYVPVGSNYTP